MPMMGAECSCQRLLQAKKLGMYMFSRQAMIMSGRQTDESGHYPIHQLDSTVGQEVEYMLAWLSCITAQKA